jgi:hypothetical protein
LIGRRLSSTFKETEEEARKMTSEGAVLLVAVGHPYYNIYPTPGQVANRVIEEASKHLNVPFECTPGVDQRVRRSEPVDRDIRQDFMDVIDIG